MWYHARGTLAACHFQTLCVLSTLYVPFVLAWPTFLRIWSIFLYPLLFHCGACFILFQTSLGLFLAFSSFSRKLLGTISHCGHVYSAWYVLLYSHCSNNPQVSTLVTSVRDWRERTLGTKISTIQTKQTRRNKGKHRPQIMWWTMKGRSWSNH